MRGLLSILLLFYNTFDKFNNTEGHVLDSMYFMTIRFLKNHIFGMKMPDFAIFYAM